MDTLKRCHYEAVFEKVLSEALKSLKGPSLLLEAVSYSLKGQGKRLRPLCLLMTAEECGKLESAIPAALAVEYFHTASLIVDDLPCMDNDPLRRGVPSVHKQFGEATALLASYALIAEAYDLLRQAAQGEPLNLSLALQFTSQALGAQGLSGGQLEDLVGVVSEEGLLRILKRKTGALFELSFVLGWIYGGGDHAKVLDVKNFASSLGLVFQLKDDLDDLEKDAESKSLNAALLMGEKWVMERIEVEKAKMRPLLQEAHFRSIYDKVSLYFS